MSVDIIGRDTSTFQQIGLNARVSNPGIGTTNGYTLSFIALNDGPGGDRLSLLRSDGEIATSLDFVDGFTLTPGAAYRLNFIGNGASFTGQIYNLSDLTNPLASLSATDATYDVGQVGLLVSSFPRIDGSGNATDQRADATFDNFSVTAVAPEPATLGLLACGLTSGLLVRRRQI